MSKGAIVDLSAPLAAPSPREGRLAELDMYDWRDLKLLGRAIRDGWISSIAELREWQAKLTVVRETTDDEKAVIAATAVQATVVKTLADSYTKALKAVEGPAQQNHLHLHDSFATMSADELRNYIADRQRALAGGNGSSKAQAGGA